MNKSWKTAAELMNLVVSTRIFFHLVMLEDIGEAVICQGCKRTTYPGKQMRHAPDCSVATLLTKCLIAGRDRYLEDIALMHLPLLSEARRIAIQELRDAGVDC